MGHRDELLRAARTLLESRGYARITARDLVTESRTNLASIGYHFGSKDGLLTAALGGVLEEWTGELVRLVMAERAQPWERVVSTWAQMLDSLPRKRPLLLAFVELVAQAEHNPELRRDVAEHYRHCRARVAEIVAGEINTQLDAAGHGAGERLSKEDPQCLAIATFVIATCDGLATQWLIDEDNVPTSEVFRSALTAFGAMVGAATASHR